MRRILDLIGMSAGGWVGWTLGVWVSIFTGFLVGIVGTALGLYLTRRVTKELLP